MTTYDDLLVQWVLLSVVTWKTTLEEQEKMGIKLDTRWPHSLVEPVCQMHLLMIRANFPDQD